MLRKLSLRGILDRMVIIYQNTLTRLSTIMGKARVGQSCLLGKTPSRRLLDVMVAVDQISETKHCVIMGKAHRVQRSRLLQQIPSRGLLERRFTTICNEMAPNDQGIEMPAIFLGHSGAQKNFAEQLWLNLQAQNRHAFIDTQSLHYGKCFSGHIYEALAKCQLGVFFLSEEFFIRSIWPMHELQHFLQANSGENSHLLPLFFGISPDDLKNPDNERRWVRIWQKWAAKDGRVDVSFWRHAIRVLKSYNVIVFQKGMREVEYRRVIVEIISDIVPPHFIADLSYVWGGERFCQEMISIMNQLPCKGTRLASGTQIVPVYGSSGMGKTTLCRIMCNYYRRICRVCHIRVGAHGLDHLTQQKIVIRQLTGASESLLQHLTDADVVRDSRQIQFYL